MIDGDPSDAVGYCMISEQGQDLARYLISLKCGLVLLRKKKTPAHRCLFRVVQESVRQEELGLDQH